MKIIEVINVDFSLRHFLLPLMRGMRARGHEVIGACAEGPLLADVRDEGFRVVGLPLARRASLPAQWEGFRALNALLREERPDLVHGHMPLSGFLARVAAQAAGVPKLAYTCHGFLFNQPSPWPRRAASFAMEFLAGQITDVFMTVSEKEAADARRYRIARHATAIGNGRDPAIFQPNPAARARIRAQFGLTQGRVVVLAVARLVAHKGHAELAQAMREVDAELWVVGERLPSDRGPDMEAALRGAGLGGRLRMLGYRADVADLLAAADIFALPSSFEGLPMSAIEAMLCGLPVVASAVSGPMELVQPDITGLLVPPREVAPLRAALRRLVAHPEQRRTMGEAGRQRALARYTEDAVRERTLDLLGL
jgi:glycosyltransferase involved in cell wall biosynthesis